MDVLEVLHILADDEQVILPFVNDLEFLDGLASSRMKDSEQQLRLLPRPYDGRHSAEIQPIIPHIERRRTDKVHATARAFTGNVHRVIAVHRAHPRGVAFGFLRNGRNHESTDDTEANCKEDFHDLMVAPYRAYIRSAHLCGLVAFPS